MGEPAKELPTFHCSFCAQSNMQVQTMIAGPDVFICNECVARCVDVLIGRDPVARPQPQVSAPPTESSKGEGNG